jgi:large repetitive protein
VTDSFDGDDIDSDNEQNDLIYSIVTLLGTNEGSVIVNTDGTFTYDPDGDFEYLAEDETATVSFTYKATDDHGSTSNVSTVSITVTGVNDLALIGGVDTGSVTEDTGVVLGNLVAAGLLTITDPDVGENSFIASTQTGSLGTLTLDTAGNWDYEADNSQVGVQSLGVGDSKLDIFTINSFDGTAHQIKVTVTGVNDVPVANAVSNSGAEDSTYITITLVGTDIDVGDSIASFKVPTLPSALQGVLYTDALLTNAVIANSAIAAAGNSLTLYFKPALNFNGNVVFDYIATDSDGVADSATAQATITVNPAGDAALIGGVDTGSVTEDTGVVLGNLVAAGLLTITDPDVGENSFIASTQTGSLGTLTLDTAGNWGYEADNSQVGVQSLGVGDSKLDIFTINSFDGTAHQIKVTVTGVNDVPVANAVSNSGAEDSTYITITLAGTDIDVGDSIASFKVPTLPSALQGVLYTDALLTNAVIANSAIAAVGNSLTLYFKPALNFNGNVVFDYIATDSDGVADSATAQATITVNPAGDAALIGGVDTGSVTEDTGVVLGNLVAAGLLTITDPDVGENSFIASTQTGSLGTLTLDTAGNWDYEADNSQVGVQSLGVGDSKLDIFTINSFDGTAHQIKVTVTGVNDVPVANAVSNSGAEDSTYITITLVGTDIDVGDSIASFKVPTLPSALQGVLYTDALLTNAVIANSAIAAVGNSLTLYFKPALNFNGNVVFDYIATDSDGVADSATAQATITVNPAGDAALIGGVDTGSVTEDTGVVLGNLVAAGLLTITDPDVGENSFIASTQTGSLGTLTLDTAGNWDYEADNSQVGVQSLGVGDSKLDIFTINSFDGTAHQIKVTVTGVNDVPVANAVSNSGAEDSTYITITLAGTDIDVGDSIASFKVPTLPSALQGVLYTDALLTNAVIANSAIAAVGNSLTLYFKPALNFNGNVVFDYIATDSDGVADSATAQATITVNPAGDAALIGGVDTGSVTEDTGVVLGNLVAAGLLTITDPDVGENSFIASTQTGSLGTLTLDTAGNWDYEADNSQVGVQSLGVGDSKLDIFTINSFDGTAHQIKVTVTGVNDVPVANAVSNSGAEDSTYITITLAGTDIDVGDSIASFKVPTLPSALQGVLYTDALLTNAVIANSAIAAVGNSLTLYFKPALNFNGNVVFDYIATDSDGVADSATAQATITVNPAGDAALIGGVDTGSVTEDTNVTAGNLVTIGLLTITDPDAGESEFLPSVNAGILGSLTLNKFGLWEYNAVNSQSAIQSLGAGDSVQEMFTIFSVDGTSHQVVVTVNGQNDPALISGNTVGSVTEDTAVVSGDLVAAGILTISDIDTGEAEFLPSVQISSLGTLTINKFGTWQYTADNDQAAIQSLNTGDMLSDIFTVQSVDGTTKEISISIHGQDEIIPPVVLDLNNDGEIELISYTDSNINIATLLNTADNVNLAMGWVGPNDGILVYDPEGIRDVTDINQISFVSYTPGAHTDLEGLVAFDTNSDNSLDLHDEKYGDFGVWQDMNSNGLVDEGEYATLAERGIVSLSLASDHQTEVIAENLIYGYTSYETEDGQEHLAADVGLMLHPTQQDTQLSLFDIDAQLGTLNFNELEPSNSIQVTSIDSTVAANELLPPPLPVEEASISFIDMSQVSHDLMQTEITQVQEQQTF